MKDENDVITNQAAIYAWDQKDIDARAIIYCNVEIAHQIPIEGCRTSSEMWDRILLQYAQAVAAYSNLLLARFFEYRYNPDHTVMSHIARLTQWQKN